MVIMFSPTNAEDPSSVEPFVHPVAKLASQRRAAFDNAKKEDGSPAEPRTVRDALCLEFGLVFGLGFEDIIEPSTSNYIGGSVEILHGAFELEKLTGAQNGIDVLVIISAHGDPDGNVPDLIDGQDFKWTPQNLWEGLKGWDGLREVVLRITNQGHRLRIVAAQCHGAVFAEELWGIVQEDPEFENMNITVDGLFEKEVDHRTIDPSRWAKYHEPLSVGSCIPKLTEWFTGNYGPKKINEEEVMDLVKRKAKKQRKSNKTVMPSSSVA